MLCIGKSKANGFEAHHMVEETETKSFVKDSNSPRNSSDTTDVESTGSRRKINNENNTINYFSMTEEDITKERNKIKDDADDLFKDINSKERVNLRRSDDHGWDEDELNIMI